MKIPKTRTGQYQISYLDDGLKYEYCKKSNICKRLKELEQDDDIDLIGVDEVPPISLDGSPHLT